MTLAIREAAGDADLATYAAIVNAGSPEDPTSVAELRWSDATYPGGLRLLADLDGRTVGAASVGRIYVYPPEFRTCGARSTCSRTPAGRASAQPF